MTTVSPVYGSPVTHTITLASLASDTNLVAGRQGTVIDNTAELSVDAVVGGKVTTGTGPTAFRQIEVWLYGSHDGTLFTAGAGAADAAFNPGNEKVQLKLLTVIPTDNTANKTYEWSGFSVAQAFGGVMPLKWGVYIVHNCGSALNATAGNHSVAHTPVKYQAA